MKIIKSKKTIIPIIGGTVFGVGIASAAIAQSCTNDSQQTNINLIETVFMDIQNYDSSNQPNNTNSLTLIREISDFYNNPSSQDAVVRTIEFSYSVENFNITQTSEDDSGMVYSIEISNILVTISVQTGATTTFYSNQPSNNTIVFENITVNQGEIIANQSIAITGLNEQS